MREFLAVDKERLGKGLKSIDILVMAQIEEFQRNGLQCYMTTEQLSTLFGESERTVERCLERLVKAKQIVRQKKYVAGSGRGNCQRILSLPTGADKTETLKNGVSSRQINSMEAPEKSDGSARKSEWTRHNGGIKEKRKENEKEKKKENLQFNLDEFLQEFFTEDEETERERCALERESEGRSYELFGGYYNRDNGRSFEELENDYLVGGTVR